MYLPVYLFIGRMHIRVTKVLLIGVDQKLLLLLVVVAVVVADLIKKVDIIRLDGA